MCVCVCMCVCGRNELEGCSTLAYPHMTHSQNLKWANGLMFAHAKSKPTIMLCISILSYCVIQRNTYDNHVFVT